MEFGDVDTLKDAVSTVLDQEKPTEECANYGKRMYLKENMYKNYIKLYEKCERK